MKNQVVDGPSATMLINAKMHALVKCECLGTAVKATWITMKHQCACRGAGEVAGVRVATAHWLTELQHMEP